MPPTELYCGSTPPQMTDLTLAERLASVAVSALVITGESGCIVDAEYSRSYAAAIPAPS